MARGMIKAALHSIFIWPSVRMYYMWFGFLKRRTKKKEKEKILIIED